MWNTHVGNGKYTVGLHTIYGLMRTVLRDIMSYYGFVEIFQYCLWIKFRDLNIISKRLYTSKVKP